MNSTNISEHHDSDFAAISEERAQFEAQMEQLETPWIRLSGLSESDGEVTRHWATFDFQGSPFRVRYFMFGDESKPFLIMSLGYMRNALMGFQIFKGLSKHFRVLIFDAFDWGANTRPESVKDYKSPKKSEQVLLHWYTGFMQSIDHLLPANFFVYCSCSNTLPMCLWILKNRHRVKKLFCGNPVGFDMGDAPDPYTFRTTDDAADALPDKKMVERLIYKRENYIHSLSAFARLPKEHLAKVFELQAMELFPTYSENEEFVSNYAKYNAMNYSNLSELGVAYQSVMKHPVFAIHSLATEDRLLNWQEFPICIAYGDRDFLGSEGADTVIAQSKHFKTGESQLIRVPDCGHSIVCNQPNYLVGLIVGFFYGTMRGRFELKPRKLFVPHHVHKKNKAIKTHCMGKPRL